MRSSLRSRPAAAPVDAEASLDGRSPCADRSTSAVAAGVGAVWATPAAWGIALAGFLLFAFVAVRQHDTFHTRARDMGIYAQVIWNTGQGRPFASTLLEDNRLHIAEHVAPVMALIVPLYALLPDPRILLLLQQASLAAAGLPLFFWARSRIGDVAALALLFEEETAPIVGAAGAYLWLRHRQWTGFGLGALATAWLLILTLVVMPGFHDRRTLAGVEGNRTVAHYEQVQERPAIVLEWLAGSRGAHAAAWILLPTLGLPLLAPQVLWIAVPSFVLLFLADREGNVVGHWAGGVLPVYWFAAAAGLSVLFGRAGRTPARMAASGRMFAAVLALVIVFCFWEYSYFPGGGEYDTDWLAWTEHEENLGLAVALVPPGVKLDASRRAVPHLAHREEVYQFPSTLYSAPMRPDLRDMDVFLFDVTDSQTRRALDATDQDTVLTRRPRFTVRVWGEIVLLLTRDRPMPRTPADASFGGALRLFGADLQQRQGRVRLLAHWESVGKVGAWTRTAELIGPDGTVVATVEGVPLDPYLPPNRWDRGQIVVEAIDLRPPPDAPAGTYRVRLRWQDAQGAAVPADRGATVEVGAVTLP